MNLIHSILFYRITSQCFDQCAASVFCYFSALFLLVLGSLKVRALPMDEAQAFVAVLLILAVSLQLVLCGLMLDWRARLRYEKRLSH